MAKRTNKPPPLSPTQQQQLNTKLAAIMQSIQQGQLPPARSSLLPLLRKHPASPEVNHVASGLHAALNEPDRAMYYARRAIDLAPTTAEYHAALGSLLVQGQEYDQAIESFNTALKLQPDLKQVLVPLATAQMQLGLIQQARQSFTLALKHNPDDLHASNNLALLESDTAHAHKAIEITQQALARLGEEPILLDALCMYSCYSDTLTPEQVFETHARFGKSVQSRVRTPRAYPHTPDPSRRIRVGFVSPDLREHSIAYFLAPIVEHLDRQRFEVCLYHTSAGTDSMSDRLRAHADLWRSCPAGLAQAHKQILNDKVDLLVELNGHFAGNLLPLFAARPCPLSVSMIGYANTTGLESIDARIIDNITDPSPQADALATESLVRLPGCFLCYQPPLNTPEPIEPEHDRPFTFGSFNDLRKISPSCLGLWAQILRENPDTHLLLKATRLSHKQVQDQLTQRLLELGIEPQRCTLMGYAESTRAHLDLYNRVDCALDTFPYTGTTTTCEAMHMGVPTITLLGQSHAGRVSASLLHATDQPELIAKDHDEYRALASKISAAGPRSADQRRSLRARLNASSLCDPAPYTQQIADAFSALWTDWCRKQGGAT